MPNPLDPTNLEGDALTRWYMRSPDEIEQARQDAYSQRYNDFFGKAQGGDPDPGFERSLPSAAEDVDPGFSQSLDEPAKDVDPGFNWVQVGPNRFRSQPASADNEAPATDAAGGAPNDGAVLDQGLAGPSDGAEIIDVGNPANPRLRKEWEKRNGQPWPRDPTTGRNHDVAHIVARADGGTDTLDNIKPQHPDLHRQEHMQNGDFARWGKRAIIPNAAASEGMAAEAALAEGRVLPGWLALLQTIPIISGVIAGRIRHDTPGHFFQDGFGVPDISEPQPPPRDLIA